LQVQLLCIHNYTLCLAATLEWTSTEVLVIDRPGIAPGGRGNDSAYNIAIDVFRNELKKSPSIESVSTSITVPGKQREYKAHH
jgi:hypothetical protein